ncbi:unnamed protein product [Arabidopsis halleri]
MPREILRQGKKYPEASTEKCKKVERNFFELLKKCDDKGEGSGSGGGEGGVRAAHHGKVTEKPKLSLSLSLFFSFSLLNKVAFSGLHFILYDLSLFVSLSFLLACVCNV